MSRMYYQHLSEKINGNIGRRALSAEQMESMVKKARRIRSRHGARALWSYATDLPEQLFTEREIFMLRQSPEFHQLSFELIDFLTQQGVVTPWEAQFMKQRI